MHRADEIVSYAARYVPYYQKLLETHTNGLQFYEIPLNNKDNIVEDESKFYSSEYHQYPKSKNIIYQRTSGSTGKQIKVIWDSSDYKRSLLGLWIYRKKYYDINPQDRYCYFYTTSYIHNQLTKELPEQRGPHSLGFSKTPLYKERIKEIYEKMVEFNPIWIMMQPSFAVLLAQSKEENKLPNLPDLKYVELTGEFLTDDMRKMIQEAFSCRIANQYGCNEVNSIAYECPFGHLHVMDSSVVIEVIGENGSESGDLHVTSLHNHAMPFIRYNTGDQGRSEERR